MEPVGLVLSREVGEQIICGHDREVVITLVKSGDGKARIGILAPRDWPILRAELIDDEKT